ncbi:ORF6N domain-containing protein [Methanomethylovorans hollandica DSM 15978]|uniref:ORF6N domain-containing protein n=1 Tax=Methanomethylovorans hollandica (strain DSM 15978 / NBRC 107637 / DMS1) TaxID=867904 RepID=L0KZL2_METHD|nr:ORF6N domain-containing protein [Methanomethylovorans hollandica]AGB49538.1 ORF6N domain-containing protein [Methanomethylovorans hollandica DSM 15978]
MGGSELIVPEQIQSRIYTIRGLQVTLDEDLAALYHVETRVLNQAVKRNKDRFPEQFCFQLTTGEYERLRSQIVILENDEEFSNWKSQIVMSDEDHGIAKCDTFKTACGRVSEEFGFQLSAKEYNNLRSQNATIEHVFKKEYFNFSKSCTASGLYWMKLRSNLLRNIARLEGMK